MKIHPILRAICGLALSFTLAGAVAAAGTNVDKVMGQGGLKKTSVKGLALAYSRPGASLASYKRVMIEPVEVAFDKNWNPERAGGRMKLSKERREEIRAGVARIAQEEYAKELAKGNYPVVTEPGPDVLRVKLSLIDVFINAPDASGPGRVKTYAPEAGHMTLVAELSDSTSKQVLARVADRREVGADRLSMTGSGVNEQDFRVAAAAWAAIMRQALDKAHAGIGNK
jgi:hypothetical protein